MFNEISILGYIEHIASIAAACAIIYTAWVGNLQLGEWKKEKLFDRRAEHAIKVINMVHLAKKSLFEIRNPFMQADEQNSAIEYLKENGYPSFSYSEHEDILRVRVLLCRLESQEDIFSEISNYAPIASFIFDDSIGLKLVSIFDIYEDIRFDARLAYGSKNREIIDNIENLFWNFKETDKYEKKIIDIINYIESRIQEVMGTKSD